MSPEVCAHRRLRARNSAILRPEAGEQLAPVARDLQAARKLLYEGRAAYRKLGVAGLNWNRDNISVMGPFEI